jgi:hypothetical protein
MKVRLLNVDLIRTFGGSIIEMNDNQAYKYIKNGTAVAYISPVKSNRYTIGKTLDAPEEDKTVWSPPEKKLFKDQLDLENNPFPGPYDKLFKQIK